MKFRKKPVEVDAVQYTEYGKLVKGMCNSQSCYASGNTEPHVHTIHRQIVNLDAGDWIIPEPDGEHYYPCKPDIFAKTYDAAGDGMSFGGALEALKAGKRVCRAGWNGKGMYLGLWWRDSYRTIKFVYIKTEQDIISPWQPSQTDMLASDWMVVE